jgi:asparagine synthetase B (glutamine-hydrolysing)
MCFHRGPSAKRTLASKKSSVTEARLRIVLISDEGVDS